MKSLMAHMHSKMTKTKMNSKLQGGANSPMLMIAMLLDRDLLTL